MMEDRFYRGFVAGIAGGLPMIALGHLIYSLGFTTLRWADWTAILIFGHVPPFSLGEQLFALFILLGWCGAVGSIFAYFILLVSNRKILLKAWSMGTAPFFVIYLLTTLFQTPGTVPLPLKTVLSNYTMVTVYSLIMGYGFKVLDQTVVEHRSPLELLAHPAAKPSAEDKRQHPDNDAREGT